MTPIDERPHDPGPELRWAESWSFDFVSDDGTLGGWARLTSLPNLGRAWYHAFLVGPHRQLAAVVDLDVPVPDASLEIRTTGLWATHICETPLDHWTIGLEAFALGVDDPAELYGRQFGDQVPLGFDLEWEALRPAVDGDHGSYRQSCQVSGEVLVGREQIDLDGRGERVHEWGMVTAWDHRWFRLNGRVGDTEVEASVTNGDLASAVGIVDGVPAEVTEAAQTMSGPGIPAAARLSVGSLALELDPVGITPVELVDPEGRRTLAPRALCRLTTPDGGTGWGWAEWNEPQP